VSQIDRCGSRAAEIFPALFGFLTITAVARLIYVGFSPPPVPLDLVNLGFGAVLVAIGLIFEARRYHPVMADLFKALGFVHLAYTAAIASAAIVFYTGREFPFADAAFVAADQALGLDWVAHVKWMDRHPFISMLAQWAYDSIRYQPLVLVIVVILAGQTERAYGLLAMMVIALATTSAVALFLPALGPYQFFKLSVADHPNLALTPDSEWIVPITWLRAAVFDTPAPPLNVGLISFPSYHAATAILYIWVAWQTPWLKWIALVVNSAMLLGTPVHGSHYFVDVIAGSVLAAATIPFTLWLFARISHLRWPSRHPDARQPERTAKPA
jgi:membrane-associated phospholipid phosphatase